MLADLQEVSQRGRSLAGGLAGWRAGGLAGGQAGMRSVQGSSCVNACEQSGGAEAGKQNRTRQTTLARMRQICHLGFPPGRGGAFMTAVRNIQVGSQHSRRQGHDDAGAPQRRFGLPCSGLPSICTAHACIHKTIITNQGTI